VNWLLRVIDGCLRAAELDRREVEADTAVNTPISVPSAINIPTDFGHHAWVVDIQPQVNARHR
jgi:hypothetical protein